MSMKVARRKALQQKLLRLPADAQKGIRVALANAGAKVANQARALVPVATGNLRDSIRWEFQTKLGYGNQKEFSIVIGPDVTKIARKMTNLPRWVEFGTQAARKGEGVYTLGKKGRARARTSYRTHSGTAPQPFLFPAWEMHKKSAKAMVAVEVRTAIKAGVKQPVASNE